MRRSSLDEDRVFRLLLVIYAHRAIKEPLTEDIFVVVLIVSTELSILATVFTLVSLSGVLSAYRTSRPLKRSSDFISGQVVLIG